ncbi:MAG: glycosyltransferase [Pseudobdellovibrionaceae bacterium]
MHRKIIFISGLQIFPAMSGGQLRSANLCISLADLGYEVEVYSLTGRKKDYLSFKSKHKNTVSPRISETVDMNPLWGLLQFVFYKLDLPPLWITFLLKFYVPKDLTRILSQDKFVILDFPFLYPIFDKILSQEKWLNTHNAEFELCNKSPYLSKKVKEIELKSFGKAEHILFCSDNDRHKFLFDTPSLLTKSSILSNGVDLKKFNFEPPQRQLWREKLNIKEQHTVFLFTGSAYAPNKIAFDFLKKFCAVHKDSLVALNAVIVIAGSVHNETEDNAHFKVMGQVDNIAPYFWMSDFGLNAVTSGSGVNVKMIEFLAAKLPILSTQFGCRGLELIDKKNCLIFDSESLMHVIHEAVHLDSYRRSEMALRAFETNENQVSMTKNLKTVIANKFNVPLE